MNRKPRAARCLRIALTTVFLAAMTTVINPDPPVVTAAATKVIPWLRFEKKYLHSLGGILKILQSVSILTISITYLSFISKTFFGLGCEHIFHLFQCINLCHSTKLLNLNLLVNIKLRYATSLMHKFC